MALLQSLDPNESPHEGFILIGQTIGEPKGGLAQYDTLFGMSGGAPEMVRMLDNWVKSDPVFTLTVLKSVIMKKAKDVKASPNIEMFIHSVFAALIRKKSNSIILPRPPGLN